MFHVKHFGANGLWQTGVRAVQRTEWLQVPPSRGHRPRSELPLDRSSTGSSMLAAASLCFT